MKNIPFALCLAVALFSANTAFAGNPIPIPEPSSLAMIGGGIVAAALLKFRRK